MISLSNALAANMTRPKLYGIWEPVKDEPGRERRWMEWWPSVRAMRASMKARIYRGGGLPVVDPSRHVFREDRPDAQWGGSEDQSIIYLYQTPDSEHPYATLEFGPRGGLQQRNTPIRKA